eukprot:NODE_460_length_8176_cov_0.585737.p2 type:complete len:307 gc:universal NODE_460_length_8176_cov_0.585737:6882-5962(-)
MSSGAYRNGVIGVIKIRRSRSNTPMFYLTTIVCAALNAKLLKTFDRSVNVDQVISRTIKGSKVTDYKVKGNEKGSIWESNASKCEKGCTLTITTQLDVTKRQHCKAFFQFALVKGEYSQGDTFSDCVLVNENTFPMKIEYFNATMKNATQILDSVRSVSRNNEKDAIKKHLGAVMRLNTYFTRFKFEKAFELEDSDGSLVALTGEHLVCYNGDLFSMCSQGFTVEISSAKVLVMKYVPTFLSSTILYILVEKNDKGYIFKQFFIKPSYFEAKRKTYYREVSCKHSASCFMKLSLGFKKIINTEEIK